MIEEKKNKIRNYFIINNMRPLNHFSLLYESKNIIKHHHEKIKIK